MRRLGTQTAFTAKKHMETTKDTHNRKFISGYTLYARKQYPNVT